MLLSDSASRKYLARRYLLGIGLSLFSRSLSLIAPFLPHPDIKRPIFIVGCSRSGTDIFVDLFGRHSDLANWSEAAQVWEIDYYKRSIDHHKERSDVTTSDMLRIKTLFGLYIFLKGKKRFVNKHPQNSLRLDYIRTIFPDAQFIHVIRDGRAVAFSNYEKARREAFRHCFPFGNFPKPVAWRDYLDMPLLTQFAYQWRDIIMYVRGYAKNNLSEENYLEVRYEDFCRDPRGVLRGVDAFAGLEAEQRDWKAIPDKLKSRNYKWRHFLRPQQVRTIEMIQGELLRGLGYNGGDATS